MVRSELDAMSARLTTEFRSGLADLRSELNTNVSGGRSTFSDDVELFKADMRAAFREQRRWMFFFWVTTELALVAAEIL